MCLAPGIVEINKSYLNGKTNQYVACRRCPECLRSRQLDWFVRMAWELQEHSNAYFTTLTYSPQHLPISEHGQTLDRKDLQNFNKRFLYYGNTTNTFSSYRHYSIGEYGSTSFRPHYHQIIFTNSTVGANLSDIVSRAWDKGRISVTKVTPRRLMYVAKYSDKRLKDFKGYNPEDTRIPEFSVMSKGIGLNYLTDERIKYHKDNDSLAIYDPLNHMVRRLPQYYINKIWTTDIEKYHILRIRRELMRASEDLPLNEFYRQQILRHEHIVREFDKMGLPDLSRIAI